MKKLLYYAGVMVIAVILLPLLIVKSCGLSALEKPETKPTPAIAVKINVYFAAEKQSKQMDMEEYIKGVVAAEMPASFELEALKAQAVAARTFAYGRIANVYKSKPGVHDSDDICTDSTHCQAWISKETAKKNWGIFFGSRNWNKIEKAVNETKGIIVTYNGQIANTLFHSNSGGRTENSEEVWDGVNVPYLRSVLSSGEEASKEFEMTTLVKTKDFIDIFKSKYPDINVGKDVFSGIKVLNYTTGGRVGNIKIGNTTMKGTEFRSLLSLRSSNFKINRFDKVTLKITVTGNGHGVGMSQWGADSLAKKGGTFIEILKYYYTGVNLMTIGQYTKKGI
jgi:stage II sporulation protein D